MIITCLTVKQSLHFLKTDGDKQGNFLNYNSMVGVTHNTIVHVNKRLAKHAQLNINTTTCACMCEVTSNAASIKRTIYKATASHDLPLCYVQERQKGWY